MAKSKTTRRRRFSRTRSAIRRATSSPLVRAGIFGGALAAVIGLGMGVANGMNLEDGWKRGLLFAGLGIAGATLARKVGAGRVSTPLMTAGLGMGVVSLLHNQVAGLTAKTQENLTGFAAPSGGAISYRPVNQGGAVAYSAPAASQPKQSTLGQVANVAVSLAPAIASVIASMNRGGMAAPGGGEITSYAQPISANGLDDYSFEGAQGLNDYSFSRYGVVG